MYKMNKAKSIQTFRTVAQLEIPTKLILCQTYQSVFILFLAFMTLVFIWIVERVQGVMGNQLGPR